LKSTFIAADIFDTSPSSPLSTLDGKIDIIYTGSFLHLFGYAEQFEICKRIVRLLRDRKGSLLVGRQVGNLDAGEQVHRTNKSQTMFRHNVESFKKLWDEVGESTGTKWRVEAELSKVDEGFLNERSSTHGPNVRRLRFSVWRE
jgi:hypothetical protein